MIAMVQVMTGDTHIRHIEDIDSRALTYAETESIKAAVRQTRVKTSKATAKVRVPVAH
jgi:hypothetical protein